MRVQLKTKNRKQIIELGTMIGDFISASKRENPWFITINGDHDSGKSLIALAIDKKFRPQEYPNGILSKNRHVADNLMKGPVVFRNLSLMQEVDKADFDEALAEFQKRYGGGSVYITSNLKRVFTPTFNRASDGLDSDLLDISIRMKRGWGSTRYVTIVARDENLATALLESSMASKISRAQSCAPRPPA